MAKSVNPEVSWAQRSNKDDPAKNVIFLTVFATDVPDGKLKVDLTPTSLTVEGPSDTKKVNYSLSLDFYAEINVAESKKAHTARDVMFVLRKKEAQDEYWPRLTKEKARLHFLKTDFDRWVDEEEQEEKQENDLDMGGGDFGGIYFSKLTGGGGMPDLASMGGMGGMGDMGDMGDMGSFGGADEADDDEMPALEDEQADKAEGAAAGKEEPKDHGADKAKIEEVS